MTQIAVSGVAVEFGATALFHDVSFTVGKGDRWGIIGRNGSGKTTLFRLITGELQPTAGVVSRPAGLRVVQLEQHREFPGATTVWDAAAFPFAELRALEHSLAEQATEIAEAGERATPQMLARYDRDLERFQREGGYTFSARVDAVLHGLGFDPDRARTQPIAQLSGGERGRLGLARQLVVPADILLLDEPTNHLDLETTRWLEEYLLALPSTLLVISHDRAFLERVVDHVLHFEAGTATPYTGSYASFAVQHAERRLARQRAFEKQQRTVSAEEEYIRRNIAGQNSRQAKGRRTRLARMPRLSPPPTEAESMALRLEPRSRGGDQVVVARGVRLAVDGRELLRDFTSTVTRGDIVGFIGPNGAGKSTLLRAIAGERPVEGGELRLGSGIDLAYYRQDLTQVPTDRALYDIIADRRPTWTRGQVLGFLARFDFTGDEVQRRADTLSGGERSRVALAIMMLSGANLLLLDEPTNHLDVESVEALEDALDGYEGTVLLVSHDRALLRELATRVWELRDQRIRDFPGTFAEWEAARADEARVAQAVIAEASSARRERERRQATRTQEERRAQQSATRTARRRLETAEREVATLEARIAELTERLADPSLYGTPDGTERAHVLAAELDQARSQLEDAMTAWADAAEAIETIDAAEA